MAFPIPSHLPRQSSPHDVTSKIFSKIDAATDQTLDSALVASWVAELDETIKSTKVLIHERIHNHLPEFEQQLATSKSVQERLRVLTTNVDTLEISVSDPETGLVPTLVSDLTQHATLAQEATDAQVQLETLSHLLKCRDSIKSLESLIDDGNLVEAALACEGVENLLQTTPPHLKEVNVMLDVKGRFRAARARNEEQLSEAYTRSVIISRHELTVHQSVQVRQSNAVLSLVSILSSLSSDSLAKHLATLHRDIVGLIDYVLQQPAEALSSSDDNGYKFSLVPLPPNQDMHSTQLQNLTVLYKFLFSQIFSSLPSSKTSSFPRSLSKPTTTSILNNILVPFLPSSYDLLAHFLKLAERAVSFEEEVVYGMLGNNISDRPVKAWVDGVSGHYERRRRMQFLDRMREIVVLPELSEIFFVEVGVAQVDTTSTHNKTEEGNSVTKVDAWGFDDANEQAPPDNDQEMSSVENDAWGFGDDMDIRTVTEQISPVKDNAWGFDDRGTGDTVSGGENGWNLDAEDSKPNTELPSESSGKAVASHPPKTENGEPDPSAAWGWDEDEDAPLSDESAWDDPWKDEPEPSASKSSVDNRALRSPISSSPDHKPSPKVATRLEKAANKGKKNSLSRSSYISPVIRSPATPSFSQHHTLSPPSQDLILTSSSKSLPPTHELPSQDEDQMSKINVHPLPRERYAVSGFTKSVIGLVEEIITEGRHLASSSLSPPNPSSTSSLGSILLLTAPAALDLFRALYPLKFATKSASAELGMQFANDCTYIAQEVERVKNAQVRNTKAVIGERMEECVHCFRVLSDSWFHDIIASEQQALVKILKDGARGFTNTTDQVRYDECEDAINQVLQRVRHLASQLKGVVIRGQYYTAIGMIINAALSYTLADILALSDIPEIESLRLSELCRILNALEGIFVEDPTQPSLVVAYVQSWLKFSYLSELLEASMADITYLFEEGALVDFAADELVGLVRALFADTQLRANVIAKFTEVSAGRE